MELDVVIFFHENKDYSAKPKELLLVSERCQDIEMFSTGLAPYGGSPPVTDDFTSQRVSDVEASYFVCCWPEHAVEQTVKLQVIWATMTFISTA